jgi:hypothetical protein
MQTLTCHDTLLAIQPIFMVHHFLCLQHHVMIADVADQHRCKGVVCMFVPGVVHGDACICCILWYCMKRCFWCHPFICTVQLGTVVCICLTLWVIFCSSTGTCTHSECACWCAAKTVQGVTCVTPAASCGTCKLFLRCRPARYLLSMLLAPFAVLHRLSVECAAHGGRLPVCIGASRTRY